MTETLLAKQNETADSWDVVRSDGWISLNEAGDYFTRLSGSSFSITSKQAHDWSARFRIGTRLKIVDSAGTKYFVVTVAATYAAGVTTVTEFFGGSDYTLAAGAITEVYYSYSNPPDYPDWFNYGIGWMSSAGDPPAIGNGSLYASFKVQGRTCFLRFALTAGSLTTWGGGNWIFSLPMVAVNRNGVINLGTALCRDAGVANYAVQPQINPSISTTTMTLFVELDWGTNQNNLNAMTPFAWGNTDTLNCNIQYEI